MTKLLLLHSTPTLPALARPRLSPSRGAPEERGGSRPASPGRPARERRSAARREDVETEDRRLVAGTLAGDEDATAVFVERMKCVPRMLAVRNARMGAPLGRAELEDLSQDVLVSIADIQWETNLLTNEWNQLPPDWGFKPTVLFDADIGIQSILESEMVDHSLVGHEKIDNGSDSNLYVIEGKLVGDKTYKMSYGLIGPEDLEVKLWIAPETFELHRALISDPNQEGEEPTIWQVDFLDFDRVIDIEPPPVG